MENDRLSGMKPNAMSKRAANSPTPGRLTGESDDY
jgi:hypothetical protein